MNILAFGAHPDDIEIFCGGTLLKYYQAGHQIFVALTTSGNIGSNVHNSREEIAAVREAEQLEAAALYGAQVRFLRFDDEGLQDTPETRRAVINALRWANPDVVFTNCPWDGSTDHAMTAKIISEVILSLPGKLVPADVPPISKAPSVFHWDTGAGIRFSPEVYVDISDVMEKKIEAITRHKSQYAWMDTFQIHGFIEHAEIMSRFRGLQAGCKFAEGFVPMRVHAFMPNMKLLP
jgi:N-acetylglucosamine malate deacetylase 1